MRSEKQRIQDWLDEHLRQAGRGAKKALADHMGIRQEALSRILLRDGKPRELTAAELSRAAEFFGTSLPDLSSDRGAETGATVPLVSWVSAGRMAEAGSPAPRAEKLIAMPDLDPGDYIALRVQGDSMDRISPEGSIIVINRSDRQLVNGRAYVFAVKGEATYKLWRPGPPPRLDPYSTNPANEPLFPDRKRKMMVVGRVRRTLLDL